MMFRLRVGGRANGSSPVTSEIFSKGSGGDRVVNALLFIHVLIAYLIEANVVGIFLIGRGWRAAEVTVEQRSRIWCPSSPQSRSRRTLWARSSSIFALKVGDLSTFEATSMKALIPVTIVIVIVGVVATVMDISSRSATRRARPSAVRRAGPHTAVVLCISYPPTP